MKVSLQNHIKLPLDKAIHRVIELKHITVLDNDIKYSLIAVRHNCLYLLNLDNDLLNLFNLSGLSSLSQRGFNIRIMPLRLKTLADFDGYIDKDYYLYVGDTILVEECGDYILLKIENFMHGISSTSVVAVRQMGIAKDTFYINRHNIIMHFNKLETVNANN